MEPQRLTHLIADGMQRRKRSHRLLKDDRDPAAPYGTHLGAITRQFGDVDNLAVEPRVGEQDLSPRDNTAARKNAKNGLADD